jgi:hypothetical protein
MANGEQKMELRLSAKFAFHLGMDFYIFVWFFFSSLLLIRKIWDFNQPTLSNSAACWTIRISSVFDRFIYI